MTNWKPLCVLANLHIDEPIDGGTFSLVNSSDKRIGDCILAQPELGKFLSRFTDSHGVRLDPAIMLAHPNTPARVLTSEAVIAFRDILSVSMIPGQRALAIQYPNQPRIYFSNALSLYPWMLDKQGEYLHAITPAITATHTVEKFRGMSSPEISVARVMRWDIDFTLLNALLKRWKSRFRSRKPSRDDIKLFRSLNVANHALMVPGGKDATLFDYGRIIAMWVSAFEILFHPGGGKKANLRVVCDQLDKATLHSEKLRETIYPIHFDRAPTENRNMICWTYQALYRARNAFLHGEDVSHKNLTFPKGHSIFQFAAPLYRIALTVFLDLTFKKEFTDGMSANQMARVMTENWEYYTPQKEVEDALKLATSTPGERRRKRKSRQETTRARSVHPA